MRRSARVSKEEVYRFGLEADHGFQHEAAVLGTGQVTREACAVVGRGHILDFGEHVVRQEPAAAYVKPADLAFGAAAGGFAVDGVVATADVELLAAAEAVEQFGTQLREATACVGTVA